MKVFMKYASVAIIFITITAGCSEKKSVNPNAEDSSKITEDTGTYTLESEPTAVQSYCGGGGIFILSMEPGDNFGGDVQLTLDANQSLNAKLTADLLSLDRKVTEIEIYPDSTLALGFYPFKVISENAGVKNELDLSVEIRVFGSFSPPYLKYIEFRDWVEITYPIVFYDGGKLFPFFKCPDYDGASTWIILSPTFEITIILKTTPLFPAYYLLRKRGEVTPLLVAKKIDGEFLEISLEDLWK